jgi:hypothetical protein
MGYFDGSQCLRWAVGPTPTQQIAAGHRLFLSFFVPGLFFGRARMLGLAWGWYGVGMGLAWG